MRLITISALSVFTVLVGFTPVSAQQLSEEDLYKLCTESAQAPQCQGYQVPIVLDDRPGEAGACVMTENTTATKTVCKLVVSEQKITAYYEVGEKLSFLDKRKATREIQIRPSDIKTIRYQEGEKDNSTARAVNTVLFGLAGLFTRNKQVAEITLDFVPAAPSAPTTEASPTLTPTLETSESDQKTIEIMVRRKTGRDLRQQLEQLTGLQAVVPMEEKQPEPSKPTEPTDPYAD